MSKQISSQPIILKIAEAESKDAGKELICKKHHLQQLERILIKKVLKLV